MAVGLSSDFSLHNDMFHGSYVETLAQAAEGIMERTNGAIRIARNPHIGDHRQETFYKAIAEANLIKRTNKASTADRTDENLSQGRVSGPKLLRSYQVAQTRQSFIDVGADPEVFSIILGQQVAKATLIEYLNTAALCLVTALNKADATKADRTAQSTATTVMADLIAGKQILGDRSMAMRSWLAHSNVHFHLLTEQINGTTTPNIFQVGDMAIAEGMPATLGSPMVMTDSDELAKEISSTDTWYILGLMEDAIVIEESQLPFATVDLVTGGDQLFYRIQGEIGFTPMVKGWSFASAVDADNNPTDTTLGTAAKWTQQAASLKDGPGTLVIVDASTS